MNDEIIRGITDDREALRCIDMPAERELAHLRKIEAAAKAVILYSKVTATWLDSQCLSLDVGQADWERLKQALEGK